MIKFDTNLIYYPRHLELIENGKDQEFEDYMLPNGVFQEQVFESLS